MRWVEVNTPPTVSIRENARYLSLQGDDLSITYTIEVVENDGGEEIAVFRTKEGSPASRRLCPWPVELAAHILRLSRTVSRASFESPFSLSVFEFERLKALVKAVREHFQDEGEELGAYLSGQGWVVGTDPHWIGSEYAHLAESHPLRTSEFEREFRSQWGWDFSQQEITDVIRAYVEEGRYEASSWAHQR